MSDFMKNYNHWLDSKYVSKTDKDRLIAMDEKEIEESFRENLSFGTGGIRGFLGLGTNKVNEYTIAKITQGLSEYLLKKYSSPSVVVGYDGRKESDKLGQITTEVLAGNGIKVYLFDNLTATPLVSFSVNHLSTSGGVMITASHNPFNYNGYKAYREDGSQFYVDESEEIISEISKIDRFEKIKKIDLAEGLKLNRIELIGETVEKKYIQEVLKLTINENIDKNLGITYSPLHGVGGRYVKEVLSRRGFHNLDIVKEQFEPNGNFPTAKYPNPENLCTFDMAVNLAKENNSDLIILTDPDSDRVGVKIKHKGKYIYLTGNEIGTLLIDYIYTQKKKKNIIKRTPVIVKTVVSSNFSNIYGEVNKIKVVDSLTGFKHIAKGIRDIKKDEEFLFGYEESIGFLPQSFSKDKDGITTSMLIAEMSGFYIQEGKTLKDKLEEIYTKYGFIEENLYSIELEGEEGKENIKNIMNILRTDYMELFGKDGLTHVIDYNESTNIDVLKGKKEITDLPKENVLKLSFNNKGWFAIRPSGTEPKLKIYIYGLNRDKDVAKKFVGFIDKKIKEEIKNSIEKG